jgi:hypothetical protein
MTDAASHARKRSIDDMIDAAAEAAGPHAGAAQAVLRRLFPADEDSKAAAQALDTLAAECFRISAEHGFHDGPNPLPQSLMLIVSEAAEALEAFRDDKFDYDEQRNGHAKPQGVMSELADIVIRTLDTALEVEQQYGTRPLSEVFALKMAFNETRPVGHGRVRL